MKSHPAVPTTEHKHRARQTAHPRVISEWQVCQKPAPVCASPLSAEEDKGNFRLGSAWCLSSVDTEKEGSSWGPADTRDRNSSDCSVDVNLGWSSWAPCAANGDLSGV